MFLEIDAQKLTCQQVLLIDIFHRLGQFYFELRAEVLLQGLDGVYIGGVVEVFGGVGKIEAEVAAEATLGVWDYLRDHIAQQIKVRA